jgi:beta-glucosidase
MKATRVNENTINETVENLISQMTLEQKIAQLEGCLLFENLLDRLLGGFPDGIGAITTLGGAPTLAGNADFMDKVQNRIIALNELRIPALAHCEALTGMVSGYG